MIHSPEIKDFITAHLLDDTNKLLLNARRYPDIDIPYVVDQILARRQIKEKLPEWYHQPELVFPSRLSAEQCSSAITALYKQKLLKGTKICDLTGGLGVDSYYFSKKVSEVIYIEQFPEYCKAAQHNFSTLGAKNIRIINGDTYEIAELLKTDTFYIDPARRNKDNKRIFALEDCEPDVLRLKPILLSRCQRLIVKISPMADIDETLRLLPETIEIHIVAVKNECKELLFILEPENFHSIKSAEKIKIHTVNFEGNGNCQSMSFTLEEEKLTELTCANEVKSYLYEPNAALLKSGAFKLVAKRFELQKLHKHSHLYTSDKIYPDFPGRSFKVNEVFWFSGKSLKHLSKVIPKANITARNFLLTVAEIRQRSGIKEGGDIYLFATTLKEGAALLRCEKLEKNF